MKGQDLKDLLAARKWQESSDAVYKLAGKVQGLKLEFGGFDRVFDEISREYLKASLQAVIHITDGNMEFLSDPETQGKTTRSLRMLSRYIGEMGGPQPSP